jgi:C1A family cysteine protease
MDLPSSIDLRPQCPPVYDQGELGSCTANGIAGAIEFIKPDIMPSRLFIYYNERVMENDVSQDGGAQIHDGISSIHTQGVCDETSWPYDINQFAVKPTDDCYTSALTDVISDYSSLETLQDIKQSLAAGYPVVFGMTVYESFENPDVKSTGMVPMPSENEEIVGGHCMLIVGYDDETGWFIVRNSWSSSWGLSGYCMIPYSYIQQYASDFWDIRS